MTQPTESSRPSTPHRAQVLKRRLKIGALLALVVIAALSLYFRARTPAGTKVDSSGQQGRGPR